MKIAVIVSSLNYGGAEKQAVFDANMLSKEHEVFFIVFKNGPLIKLLNSNIKLIPVKKIGYLMTTFRLRRIIKKNKIEFIHASLNAAMLISALAAIFSKTKVFWHCHSHEFDLPTVYKPAFKYCAKLSIIKKILVVNNELLLFLRKYFNYPLNKLEVLYNTSSYLPEQKVRNVPDIKSIIYIGRLVELKRAYLLIELAEYLISKNYNRFKIILVGDGNQRSYLEKLTKDKKLTKSVYFVGFQTELESYYEQTDIFVLPSREECLSMALIDSGMKGIPAVAFDVGGNSEIIMDRKTGFIVNSKEEFFERIYTLAIDHNLRKEMGKAAAAYCGNKFGVENHINQLNALYTGH